MVIILCHAQKNKKDDLWAPLDKKNLIEYTARAIIEHPESIFDDSVPRTQNELEKWLDKVDFIDAYVQHPSGIAQAAKKYNYVSYYCVVKKNEDGIPSLYAAYFLNSDTKKLDLSRLFGAVLKHFQVKCIKLTVDRDKKEYHDYMKTLDDGKLFFIQSTVQGRYIYYRICLPIT